MSNERCRRKNQEGETLLPAYLLRPAHEQDIDPMMAIGHEGLRPHVEQVRTWDSAAEEAGFRAHFTLPEVRIIEIDGVAVGYLKIQRHRDHHWVDGIYLAASVRNRGLGSSVLCAEIDAAHRANLPLRLRVLRNNPALQLYLRLGFERLRDDPEHDSVVLTTRQTAQRAPSTEPCTC